MCFREDEETLEKLKQKGQKVVTTEQGIRLAQETGAGITAALHAISQTHDTVSEIRWDVSAERHWCQGFVWRCSASCVVTTKDKEAQEWALKVTVEPHHRRFVSLKETLKTVERSAMYHTNWSWSNNGDLLLNTAYHCDITNTTHLRAFHANGCGFVVVTLGHTL